MTRKLTARKHVRAPPRRNLVPTESHSDGQLAGYFPRTLRTLLQSLGYGEPPLFIGTPRLLRGTTYLWHVRVVLYERSTTDRVRRTRRVIEAAAPRWTFEGGIRDAARQALAVLRHEEDDQMEHSQYRHFPSRAREGDDAEVVPARGRDHVGCLPDQVKLTSALTKDLDEAVKEVRQLGDYGEEASRRITELEALCKQHEEAAKKLREEKATLEGMVQSRNELIVEMAAEFGLDRMGEDDDENDEEDDSEDEEDDDDDEGDAAAPPNVAPEVIIGEEEEDPEEMVLDQEAPDTSEVILPEEEPEPPQPRLFTVLMRDYEESPSRMDDDLEDLDDPTEADYDVDEWFPEDGSHDRD